MGNSALATYGPQSAASLRGAKRQCRGDLKRVWHVALAEEEVSNRAPSRPPSASSLIRT